MCSAVADMLSTTPNMTAVRIRATNVWQAPHPRRHYNAKQLMSAFAERPTYSARSLWTEDWSVQRALMTEPRRPATCHAAFSTSPTRTRRRRPDKSRELNTKWCCNKTDNAKSRQSLGACCITQFGQWLLFHTSLMTNLVVQVEKSVEFMSASLCVRTITFELANLWRRYLTC